VWHGLLPRHLPLHGISEWRELPGFDEAAQHQARHIGPCPVQHDSSELSSGSPVRAVMVLRVQGSERSEMQRQRKKARE
jgi:hypothetical protein